jgi:hypothetical protein
MGTPNPFGPSLEEREAIRAKVEELSADARANWDNPEWRRAMAQEITETIYWGFQHESILGALSQVEHLPFDGRSFIKEVRGLRAFWTARGGYIESSMMRSDVMEITRDTIGFHVYEFEDKVRNGFGETQANLVDLGAQRLDAEVNLRVLRMFQAAIPDTSPYYIQGAGLDLTDLDTALNEVFDLTNDGTVTVIGRRTMIGQIADQLAASNYGAFLPNTNEQIVRTGLLGTYKGANLAYLKNFKDDEDVSFFPANEMYVVARDASKFAYWAGPLSREWTDENWYWHYVSRQDFGGAVYRPERLRRIVDTSIAP